jgi:tRNA nucleotidyltransferase (CCA-adding enzyme)
MYDKSYGIAKTGMSMKVNLSETEAKICGVLQGTSNLIATERPELPVIECRIAGGWVRDKVNPDIQMNDSY